MTIIMVELGQIEDNPYQTRMQYDMVKLGELAESISGLREARPDTLGLIQVPLGRIVDDEGVLVDLALDAPITEAVARGARVQLAAGHSRKRAFELLAESDPDNGWHAMPVDIGALGDQVMMDIAWEENAKRKDLTPIEEAHAIRRAMVEFGYTLTQVAERWKMSTSAASNKVRLLELPPDVQSMVMQGLISERHGRELLPLVQVAMNDEECKRLAWECERKDWTAREVGEAVKRRVKHLTSAIDPKMLEWDNWISFALPGCVEVCKGCEFERRGRCARPGQWQRKRGRWVGRMLDLAMERTGLPAVRDDGINVLRLEALQRAQRDGCAHLAIAHLGYGWSSGVLVDVEWPQIYYVCTRGYECECSKAKDEDGVDEDGVDENPYRVWLDDQRQRALAVGEDMLDYLTEQYRAVLQVLMPDELRYIGFVEEVQSGGVNTPATLDEVASALADRATVMRRQARLEGDALVYRATVYRALGIGGALNEVRARLQAIMEAVTEARFKDIGEWKSVGHYAGVRAHWERIQEELKAHPVGAHAGWHEVYVKCAELEAQLAGLGLVLGE